MAETTTRYTGFYRVDDDAQSPLSPEQLQAYKKGLFAAAPTTHAQLWDMLKANKTFTSFQDVGGRSTTRQARQEYAYRRFGRHFGKSLIDIGCDDGVIRNFFDGKYVGIDIGGQADLKMDLEKETLPFPDGSFDCILCAEVLEHLDSLHALFAEMVRVSGDKLIVTFPNNWRQLLGDMLLGKSARSEYGLPPQRPADRHKWFFNVTEAEDFVAAMCRRYNLEIAELEYVYNIGDIFFINRPGKNGGGFFYPPRQAWDEMPAAVKWKTRLMAAAEKGLKMILFGWRPEALKNIEVVNLWCVLKKKEGSAHAG